MTTNQLTHTELCDTPTATPTAAGWSVRCHAVLPAGMAPQALVAQLKTACAQSALAHDIHAELDWSNAQVLQAWADQQPDAVVLDVYATALLAIANNDASVLTFRQALAHVLQQECVSLEVLGFLTQALTDALSRTSQLEALGIELHAVCNARALEPAPFCASALAGVASHTVLARSSAQLFADEQAAGQQIEAAMRSITVAPDVPDDGRSPMQELQAIFSVTAATPQ
jgi:hypothetical protein